MLLDTGASCSVIDREWIRQLPESERPVTRPAAVDVAQAGGDLLALEGEADVRLEIDSTPLKVTLLVGRLKEPGGILGLDVLDLPEVDFSLKDMWLSAHGNQVPLSKGGKHRCCRMSVEETIVVPPDHAIWIRGKVHQARWSPQMRYGIIEPVASFSRKTGLLVDRALVNVEEPGMLVLNTQEEPQRIEAGTTVAL